MSIFFVTAFICVAATAIGRYSGHGVTTKPNLAYGSFQNAVSNTNNGGGKTIDFFVDFFDVLPQSYRWW